MMFCRQLHTNCIVFLQLQDSCISSVISGVTFWCMITGLNDHLAVLDQLHPWWNLSSSMIEEVEIINTFYRCSEDTCENKRAFINKTTTTTSKTSTCGIHCIFIRSVCKISQQYGTKHLAGDYDCGCMWCPYLYSCCSNCRCSCRLFWKAHLWLVWRVHRSHFHLKLHRMPLSLQKTKDSCQIILLKHFSIYLVYFISMDTYIYEYVYVSTSPVTQPALESILITITVII